MNNESSQNSNDNNGGNDQGANNTDNQNQSTDNQINLKDLSFDQLADVFENPNLYKHERFSKLAKDAQELKKIQEQQQQQEEKTMREQNQYKELVEKRDSELAEIRLQLKNKDIDMAIINQITKAGVVDVDAALKLIDRDKISYDEASSKVSGVEDAITALKNDRAYLFNEGSQPVGTATNVNNSNDQQSGVKKFKASQLRGPEGAKFFRENREEILKAQAAGMIEQD